MTIFSKLKSSRKTSSNQSESKDGTPASVPASYQDILTIADAMAGTTSDWKSDRRHTIQELSTIQEAHNERTNQPGSTVPLSIYSTNDRLPQSRTTTTNTTQCSRSSSSNEPREAHLKNMESDEREEPVMVSRPRSTATKSFLSSNTTPANSRSSSSRRIVTFTSSTSTSIEILEIPLNKSPLNTVTTIQTPKSRTMHLPTITTTTTMTTTARKTAKSATSSTKKSKSKPKRPAPVPVQKAKSPVPVTRTEPNRRSRMRDGILGRNTKPVARYY